MAKKHIGYSSHIQLIQHLCFKVLKFSPIPHDIS